MSVSKISTAMGISIEKIKTVLRSSPFGSGELAADFFPWEREEELMSAEDGLYFVEVDDNVEADDNVEVKYVSPENKDYPYLNRGISWREIRVPFEIEGKTLTVILGCGVHYAIYEFNLSTGEVEITPDGLPSDVFYADGKKVDISHRRRWLLSCSQ
jgi:hypothetical protein